MEDSSMAEEEMLQSFEAFMLGGGASVDSRNSSQLGMSNSGNKKKKGRKGRNQERSPSIATPTTETKEESMHRQNIAYVLKTEKQSWNNFHSFCKSVRNHWIHLDDQVFNVVSSMENIQSRLPTEMKLISKLMNSGGTSTLTQRSRESTGFLNLEDIQLALSHDLIQHEKMVAALRKLVSDLSESLQMIGRQLNDALLQYQESSHFLFSSSDLLNTIAKEEMLPSVLRSMRLVDDMNDMFLMLSRESYRKQCLSIMLLNSMNDSILGKGNSASNNPNKAPFPRALSSTIWSRKSQSSCINIVRFEKIFSMSKPDLN